jgi:hypothetical protein
VEKKRKTEGEKEMGGERERERHRDESRRTQNTTKPEENECQGAKIIPAKNPNRRGFSSFLFVLMSVSGGVHGDFLKAV